MQPFKLDVSIMPSGDLRHDVEQIKCAEQFGFDAVWIKEKAHNPFFPLTIAAKESQKIRLGTQAALAFPRSPMVTAQIAWDLARQSDGRFILGLAAQSHAESSSSDDRGKTSARMREYVASMRAIWDTFQTDARLRFRGEHYQFRLMAPFFNPGPIPHPAIPIYLAGDCPSSWQLAGAVGQGLHLPGWHTPSYLREVVLPAVENGLNAAGRDRSEIAITATVYVISGLTDHERQSSAMTVRRLLAHNSNAHVLRRSLNRLGWGTLADELSALAREERWADLNDALSLDALDEFAIIADPDDVGARLAERYGGIADRVSLVWNPADPTLYRSLAAYRN